MSDRVILHCDLNNFYASVECARKPHLRGVPIAVTGNREDRHGIVLAKNYLAKNYGVSTGEPIFSAMQKCPNLQTVTADFEHYQNISNQVVQIYKDYTNQIESFGIDECWLDVTESQKLFGSGYKIAFDIKERIKKELGITASVGVSYNKIFAKLGSDLKKPDAITEISRQNYKDVVWPLPVQDLLNVGKKTKEKMHKLNIFTIGHLATASDEFLKKTFGKWGEYLHTFANGNDTTEVNLISDVQQVKSIGNSLTNYKDLNTNNEVFVLINNLSDSVAERIRNLGSVRARKVHISIRDNMLKNHGWSISLNPPARTSIEIAQQAYQLFKANYNWQTSVRAVGVSVYEFTDEVNVQQSFFQNANRQNKLEKLEQTVDTIKGKHGRGKIKKAILLLDDRLKDHDTKDTHTIHPKGYLNHGKKTKKH